MRDGPGPAGRLLADLVDLVLPDSCPGCGLPAYPPACQRCLAALRSAPRPAVPDPAPAGLPVPWAVGPYDGALRALVVAHKEHGRLALARFFGVALARAVLAAAGPGAGHAAPLRLVPVPSSRSARRARGHDPVARTARFAVRALRGTGRDAAVLPLLTLARRVQDQAGLGAASRAANLAGAYTVRRRAASAGSRPPRLVVVDDVVTTGATLAEAVRALRAAGAPDPAVAVVAATPRRSGQASGSRYRS